MPHRRAGRFIRAHIFSTLVVLVAISLGANTFGIIYSLRLSDRIIDARQHDCQNGNVVRGHIQFVTSALHDLLALSLAESPPIHPTVSQRLLRRRFQQITDELGQRLPALAPRDCSRAGVTAGAVASTRASP
jgi:hypothetical protein